MLVVTSAHDVTEPVTSRLEHGKSICVGPLNDKQGEAMNGKKILIAALIASSPLLAALPMQAAQAQTFDLRIGTPPPPPRVIVAPAPRRGYVWAPGYWNWQGRRHVWQEGHWERERRGYHYAAPEWRQDGDRYGLRRGHWARD
jgi:hypothetical protein